MSPLTVFDLLHSHRFPQEKLMRLKAFAAALGVLLALTFARTARAQLPDLRGETFILTGVWDVTGIAFGQDFSQVAAGGITFVRQNFGRLIIDNLGTAENSNLSGKYKLPVFPDATAPTVQNPEIPLTGSFNRNTGDFSMTGNIPNTTIIDFGITDLGPPFGRRRIQVRIQSLGITIVGTGAVTNGQFRITQVGTAPFVFPTAGPPNTLVELCLQDPNQTSFGGFVDNVINSTIIQRSGASAFQPAIRGTITLEGIANPGATVKPVGPLLFTFDGVLGDHTKAATLNSDGTYVVYVSPDVYNAVKVDGLGWLRKTLTTNLGLNRDDVSGLNATLLAGDVNQDNAVDITDLLALISSYNKVDPDPEYKIAADFNRDGANDITDLLALIANYNKLGD
jgi:hypothetical protein